MTQPDWERLQNIVDAALDLDPGDRAAHLDCVCSQDQDLRGSAQALIDAHERSGSF